MKKKRVWAAVGLGAVILTAGAGVLCYRMLTTESREEILEKYMRYVEKGEYEKMYGLLDEASQNTFDKESFTERNQKIYEGIEARDLKLDIFEEQAKDQPVSYRTTMETLAGTLSFDNDAFFVKEKGEWKITWTDALIYPGLRAVDKVQVITLEAERGSLLDRNGKLLAGKGKVTSVGLVPVKMEVQPQGELEKLAQLLDTTAESIQDKLSASWVKDDSFVPIKDMAYEQLSEEQKTELLKLPGVMITDKESRVYPYGACTSHLVGYVQAINAEELEEKKGEGYSEYSILGKSGLEKLYEDRLREKNGYKIAIVDQDGNEKDALAASPAKNGEDIKLTIDVDLQRKIYETYQQDKSASVVMNPYSGEVLAMVSTPSFNSMDFTLGMSQKKWDELNESESKPLFNRTREAWVPGSSFKPVIGAIGLSTDTLSAEESLGESVDSWQKDTGWGDYKITTLHTYPGEAVLKNALVYSDNVYFAKAALKIGKDTLERSLGKIGFGEEIPFPIGMSNSQYANEKGISTEIQLADTGYGQGQVLVTPLHLASIYSAFLNQGNMIAPKLEKEEGQKSSYWIEEAFTKEAAETITSDLTAVIEEEKGSGHGAYLPGETLAGKTGTAEIKANQEDANGTELGWFVVFPTDKDLESGFLMVNMVEDVKERGGSSYVVQADTGILPLLLGQ